MIASDVQKLNPGTIVELYVLDATEIGGSLYRWVPSLNELKEQIVWDGEIYTPFPIDAKGFTRTGKGQIPQPTVTVANITGLVSAACAEFDDLLGAKFIRKRTFAKYLDAVNFPDGINPTADPLAGFPEDIFFVNRKSNETPVFIEFELAASIDVSGVKLPRRQCIANICPWKYRSTECGYTGTRYFDKNDNSVASSSLDVCGKRITSCKARFGEYSVLNFGGFPGVGLVR